MPKSTKEEIAKTLVELLQDKQLDNITVTELVEKCGISRQAFYYHFQDIYGVVDWVIQREIASVEQVTADRWWDAILEMMAWMEKYRTVILNAYRAYERSYVEHNLCRWVRPLVQMRVLEAARQHHVTERQKEFLVELCTQGLVGIVINWLEWGMSVRFDEQMDDFYTILDGSLDYMMERLEQKNK